MKIFITGGSGLLGQYLNPELSKDNDILTQYHGNAGNCNKFNSVKLSITDDLKLEEIFESFRPDLVIHAASVSTPEKADNLSSNQVYEINVNAVAKIARLCSKYNVKLIYTSTDLVYAGYRGSMLKEEAKLIPISLYAETKLMGEVKIQETFDNYIILRVALQVGFGKNNSRNNFHRLYENLKNGIPTGLFIDQFRTPLVLRESAKIIAQLLHSDCWGEIINFSGNERVSRFEIGELLCDITGMDKNLLNKQTMNESDIAYKVADVSMNNDKLKSYGIKIGPLADSLAETVTDYEREK